MGLHSRSVAAHDNAGVALALCPSLSRTDQCPADTLSAMFRIYNQATNLSEVWRVQKPARHQVDPAYNALASPFGNEQSM